MPNIVSSSLIEEGSELIEDFVATPEEKRIAEASINEFRALVQLATKRGINTKLLLHDPYLEDDEAANSLSNDLQTTFLEEEYQKLQEREWFYVSPVGATDLHPPSSASAAEARVIARNTLVDILGPRLGQTPNTIGATHIPRPLRLHRTRKANERMAGGPAYIPLHTVTASRTTTRTYSTNLKFSNVARFEGVSRIQNDDSPLSRKEGGLSTRKKTSRKVKADEARDSIENDADEGIELDSLYSDSDADPDEKKTHNVTLSLNEEKKDNENDEESKMSDNINIEDETLQDTAIDAWWDDECEDESDGGISMISDDDEWSDVVLVVAAASDVDFDKNLNKTVKSIDSKLSNQVSSLSTRKTRSKQTSQEVEQSTSSQNPLDRSVFRRFISPSLSFSRVPTKSLTGGNIGKGTSSLSDREWFRLCLVRATQKWRQSRKLMSIEAQSFSNDLATALESVMKRVHRGVSFGPVKGVREESNIQMSKTQSRLRVRELLKKIYKARVISQDKERAEPLVPISKLAGDNLLRSRPRSTSWAKEAMSRAFSENARARSASRRAALNEVQHIDSLDTSSLTTIPTSVPGVGKFTSGRDRIIAIKDKFFGVRQVLVPFTASVAMVSEAEAAKGSFLPGPGSHTVLPSHSTSFGPHRRGSAPVFSTAGRGGEKASRSSLFRAMGERIDDELGCWDDKQSSAPGEGDVVELTLSSNRPNTVNAPRLGFNKAPQRVSETVYSEAEAARIWQGDELIEVQSARNLERLSKKIARAVRFIQEQEDEQKEALHASERANNALQASASQYPRSSAFLEQTRNASDSKSLSKTLPSPLDLQDLNLFLDELLVTENIDPKKIAVSSRYLS
jgi:hypothetical protein